MKRLNSLATALSLSVFAATGAHAQTAEVWSQRGPALSEPSVSTSHFGEAVAISGSTLVVTSSASGGWSGAAYVYQRVGSDWVAAGSALTADDIPTPTLGFPCALSGDHLIIGATYAASAYAFTRQGATWGAGERLIPPESPIRDWWVTSVSVSGDTAVVGVPALNISQTGPGSFKPGAAYFFVRDGGSWVAQGKLTNTSLNSGYGFGDAVSISGDTTLVTHPQIDRAYVFTRTAGQWIQQGPALLRPAEAIQYSFGGAAVLSGDTLLINAQRLDSVGLPAGVVYEFVRTNGVWEQSASPLAPAETDERFGSLLSFSGDTALMGSRRGAYVFARIGKSWRQQGEATLLLAQPSTYVTVAVDGQYAVLGVPGKTRAEPGTAYIFSDACAIDAECGSTAFCAAGTCRARCVDDSECTNGRFCAVDGLCREPLSAGESCSNAGEGGGCKQPGCQICSTGHCVDGVCCDSACDGLCEACAAHLTGGMDGSCLPIAGDQDPDDECAEGRDFPASCAADGACDGKRACRPFAKAGTACGDTVCSDGRVTGSVCDGTGSCQELDSVPCAPYACSSAACSTSCATDADCDPTAGYCLNGKCAEKKPSGQACTAATECSTEICSDAVCCETVCDGPCESCVARGSEGQCVAVSGATCSAAGEGGSGGGGVMAPEGEEAGEGAGVDGPASVAELSATACGCRQLGVAASGASSGVLPLLGLLLLGACRRRVGRAD